MSSLLRAGARMGRCKVSVKTLACNKVMGARQTSWVPFEQPNPAIYAQSPSAKPKTSVPDPDSPQGTTSDKSPEHTDTGAQEAPAQNKDNTTPKPKPGEPVTLAQLRKRYFTTGAKLSRAAGTGAATAPPPSPSMHGSEPKPVEGEKPRGQEPQGQEPQGQQQQSQQAQSQKTEFESEDGRDAENYELLGSPTLRLCLRGQPATWPVDTPHYPMTAKQLKAWIAEGELISQGKMPRC
ncbi:hypothetical protein GGS21DRAFT_549568 [Xylaria nigripes]|nr:hypothetical protein GGS21DRAFT_549568 [Xylaria nigripes]